MQTVTYFSYQAKNSAVRMARLSMMLVLLVLFGACAQENYDSRSGYGSDDLAKKWRERTQQFYPVDNDAEYYYPKYKRASSPDGGGYYPPRPLYQTPYSPYSPAYDAYRYAPVDNDAQYYNPQRYPRYDSSADSPTPQQVPDTEEQYNYPLFFDN